MLSLAFWYNLFFMSLIVINKILQNFTGGKCGNEPFYYIILSYRFIVGCTMYILWNCSLLVVPSCITCETVKRYKHKQGPLNSFSGYSPGICKMSVCQMSSLRSWVQPQYSVLLLYSKTLRAYRPFIPWSLLALLSL